MLYSVTRALLFRLDPEAAHDSALRLLDVASPLAKLAAPRAQRPRTVMGLHFANPVGLAAGLDKNADHVDALGRLGFGFIEVGTVTPRPQPGNPKPRLFRLPEAGALINRFGFNNHGVEHLVARIARRRYRGVLGVNVGKNRDTPAERAADDYLYCLRAVYPHADYVAVNVSSPNTPGLRALQHGDDLRRLLEALKVAQRELCDRHGRYVPLALKIAPDLDDDAIAAIAAALLEHGADAVIATNTTAERGRVAHLPGHTETGGLSGRPLTESATRVVAVLAAALDGRLPIIAAGGVMSAADAVAKLAAGASLVQLYTGLVYRGPALVREAIAATAGPEERRDA